AFKGVTRDGGTSWTEAQAIDGYGSEEELQRARMRDKDQRWTELAIDKSWDAGPGIGGFGFLDESGFRYYLPAAMVRFLMVGAARDIRLGLAGRTDDDARGTHAC